ncbi:MAG TPA: dihydroxyacetone kinase subunit L [Acetobacteraceae bacterium]|jgi:dihydroxyacetone kinase-like protein|nr:dihydroxyacetone kinase subunit L [Acetobacteraceae bacterium]
MGVSTGEATTSLSTAVLADGLRRIATHMETVAEALNALDGQLGDGDLGVTMQRGGRELAKVLPTLPDDVGMALLACAQAMTRVSGSSYGTLLATGLMAAAKATRGRTEVPWSELSALLLGALEAMMARGKASLGDKTVLDVLDAAARAIDGVAPPDMLAAASGAVDDTMARMRGQPAKIGRARIFAERSVGLDDPGMLAFREMLRGLSV